MSRAGAPSRRLKAVKGIIVAPLVADLERRHDHVRGAIEEPCLVCGRTVTLSPSMQAMRPRGWVPVCTHDLARFRHVLTRRVIAPGEVAEVEAAKAAFARRCGIVPDDVVQMLPPELGWLEERMAS